MAGALLLAPVLLLADIWDSPQLAVVRDHPLPAAVGGVVALGAVVRARAADGAPPARAAAAGARRAAVPRPDRGRRDDLEPARAAVPGDRGGRAGGDRARGCASDGEPARRTARATWGPGWLERLLALSVALYGIQATYSADFDKALQQIAFFIVPFALLFVLLAQVEWTPRLLRLCLGLLVGLALVFCGDRLRRVRDEAHLPQPEAARLERPAHLLPHELGLLRPEHLRPLPRRRDAGGGGDDAADARARGRCGSARPCSRRCGRGLVLTLSQSSLGALLVGLATLAVLRWGARRVLLPAAAVVALAVAAVLVTPHTFGVNLHNLDSSSSGRTQLVSGGGDAVRRAAAAGLRQRRVRARVPRATRAAACRPTRRPPRTRSRSRSRPSRA